MTKKQIKKILAIETTAVLCVGNLILAITNKSFVHFLCSFWVAQSLAKTIKRCRSDQDLAGSFASHVVAAVVFNLLFFFILFFKKTISKKACMITKMAS